MWLTGRTPQETEHTDTGIPDTANCGQKSLARFPVSRIAGQAKDEAPSE